MGNSVDNNDIAPVTDFGGYQVYVRETGDKKGPFNFLLNLLSLSFPFCSDTVLNFFSDNSLKRHPPMNVV